MAGKVITLLALVAGAINAQEITLDHITAAVCQVETGTIWKAPGVVHGRVTDGSYGETGPWQVTAAVLADMGRSRNRNRSSVLYAETTFRLWYSSLLQKHGAHGRALAAYHRGSKGVYSSSAKAYAERVLNLAQRIAKESK